MNRKRAIRRVVFVLVIVVLLASVPSSLRYAYEHGGFYMFSKQFLIDLPKRLNGPGRFRFVLQPAVAIFLGIRAGIADGRAGRPPYILSLLSDGKRRWELLREGFAQVATLVAMAILLDAISHSPGDLSRAGLGGWSGIDRFSILSEPGAGEPVRARWEARPDGMSGFTGSGVMNHKVSAKSRLWEV